MTAVRRGEDGGRQVDLQEGGDTLGERRDESQEIQAIITKKTIIQGFVRLNKSGKVSKRHLLEKS